MSSKRAIHPNIMGVPDVQLKTVLYITGVLVTGGPPIYKLIKVSRTPGHHILLESFLTKLE